MEEEIRMYVLYQAEIGDEVREIFRILGGE